MGKVAVYDAEIGIDDNNDNEQVQMKLHFRSLIDLYRREKIAALGETSKKVSLPF